MAAPRTAETKQLELYKRQWFQWYMVEEKPLAKVEEYFCILFAYRHTYLGVECSARRVLIL